MRHVGRLPAFKADKLQHLRLLTLQSPLKVLLTVLPILLLPANMMWSHSDLNSPAHQLSVDLNSPESSYTVSRDGESLGSVAIRLYGTTKMVKYIAAWNDLNEPYQIDLGQKLTLMAKPLFSPVEGEKIVVAMWLRLLGKNPLDLTVTDAEVTDSNEVNIERSIASYLMKKGKESAYRGNLEEAYEFLSRAYHADPNLKESPTDQGIMLISGKEAAIIYSILTEVKVIAAISNLESMHPKDISIYQCERRIGRDVICAKIPHAENSPSETLMDQSGKLAYNTRCVMVDADSARLYNDEISNTEEVDMGELMR